jgi:hypothetical protein
MVGLHEEADQHGVALGRIEEAEALDTRLRRVSGQGFLQIVVEPRQVEVEHTRGLNTVQLGSQTAHRLGCRHAGRGLELVEGREAVVGPYVQQGIEAGR